MVTTGTGGPVRTWRDGPVRIIRIDRPHVRLGLDLADLAEGLQIEARCGAEVLASGEAEAGARAFREGKRES
jgi:hypothetical protein